MKIQIHTGKISGIKMRIIIIGEVDATFLQKQGLSKEEATYVISQIKESKGGIDAYFINQYKQQIWIINAILTPDPTQKEKLRIAGAKIAAALKSKKQTSVAIQNTLSSTESLLSVIEGLALASYDFIKYFSDKKDKVLLQEIIVSGKADERELEELSHIIHGTFISRDLVNEPVQYLTATRLSKEIEKLSREAGFSFEYFGKKKIESLKMGGLLGVNQGSQEEPTFNILEWKPGKPINSKPLVLVGKGVVYDTGGSSLKTSAGMEQMKGDMAGAAAVVGAIYAIAKCKLPYHVVGLIPATDNRIDNTSIVPGDILTTYSGKTVEVLNTDAEGRLILADALHYASKYKPELVIDLATLTGAAVAAIGELGIVGMEKNATEQFKALESAGWNVYERLVKFPLWEEYGELIKSNIADIKNIGSPLAGAITAGKFLEHFTSYPWIHLDLSNALISSNKHYRTALGTGAGTRLLVEFVKNKTASKAKIKK
ncbi:MAG: leucyl aminopeptidase [Flavobacteriales bacterium]|nr:leucyl aminopeptidase [Flavobacteriales bacterium]